MLPTYLVGNPDPARQDSINQSLPLSTTEVKKWQILPTKITEDIKRVNIIVEDVLLRVHVVRCIVMNQAKAKQWVKKTRRIAAGADVANHRHVPLVLLLRDHQNSNVAAADLGRYLARNLKGADLGQHSARMDGADRDRHSVQNYEGLIRLVLKINKRISCLTSIIFMV